MTREEILKMLETLNQKILCISNDTIEVENTSYGEPISFDFENDILVRIYS